MLQLGNGILLEQDGRSYRFDPRRVQPDDISMISHAHTDHLPTSFKKLGAVCSPITRDLVGLRRKKTIEALSDSKVKMLEAGHIAGSRMFLVEGETSVLYTGDFCTREKEHMKPAKPHKCDTLIMEATYGKPQYIFPDQTEIMSLVRDWLDDIMKKDGVAVLLAYPLGKSQELAASLRDMPLMMGASIAENNRVLRKHGYDLPDREFDKEAKPPFAYMSSGFGKDADRVASFRRHGAKTAAFSGWALDKGFGFQTGSIDEAFPVSDHCGYNELMEFARLCSPRNIFTTHGFAKELATHIRKNLGISAQPLLARQRTLEHFC